MLFPLSAPSDMEGEQWTGLGTLAGPIKAWQVPSRLGGGCVAGRTDLYEVPMERALLLQMSQLISSGVISGITPLLLHDGALRSRDTDRTTSRSVVSLTLGMVFLQRFLDLPQTRAATTWHGTADQRGCLGPGCHRSGNCVLAVPPVPAAQQRNCR